MSAPESAKARSALTSISNEGMLSPSAARAAVSQSEQCASTGLSNSKCSSHKLPILQALQEGKGPRCTVLQLEADSSQQTTPSKVC